MADSAIPDQGFCFFSDEEKTEMKVQQERFMLNEEKKRKEAEEARKSLTPNENGVVSVCEKHGRYFHNYDFSKQKVMNREIKCPVCGGGIVEGNYVLDIPERSHEWEY